MTRRLVACLAAVVMLGATFSSPTPAAAGDERKPARATQDPDVETTAGDEAWDIEAEQHYDQQQQQEVQQESFSPTVRDYGDASVATTKNGEPPRPRDSGLDPLCVAQAIEQDSDPFGFCGVPVQAVAAGQTFVRMAPAAPLVVVTPGMVATAFRRVRLPASVLRVQPPDGETLVNFETNFYTVAEAFAPSIVLLGRRVDLRVWPSRFSWVFDDGSVASGKDPGAAYPDLRVTHVYARKGRVWPRVDTTWGADFRVAGGPWRRVDGTVTVTGAPQGLWVREARPHLTGGR